MVLRVGGYVGVVHGSVVGVAVDSGQVVLVAVYGGERGSVGCGGRRWSD
jgi:hypothetical protein